LVPTTRRYDSTGRARRLTTSVERRDLGRRLRVALERAQQQVHRVGQDVDELVDRAQRRAAIGAPAHRLEREVTFYVDDVADHRQPRLVMLAGALEQHLVRRADAQVARLGEVDELRGLARRRRERLFDVHARAVQQAQLRE
jgi:hypothetical protein